MILPFMYLHKLMWDKSIFLTKNEISMAQEFMKHQCTHRHFPGQGPRHKTQRLGHQKWLKSGMASEMSLEGATPLRQTSLRSHLIFEFRALHIVHGIASRSICVSYVFGITNLMTYPSQMMRHGLTKDKLVWQHH